MTTENYISWIYSNAVDFESKKNENYYKNNQRVEDDLTKAEEIIVSKAPSNKKESAKNGWETIRDNIIKPDLNEQVKDLNEEVVTKMETAVRERDTFGLRDTEVGGYESSTINKKSTFTRQVRIELRSEREEILTEYEERKKQELGTRSLSVSQMIEAENQAVSEGRIISRNEYLRKSKALGE